MAFTRSVSDSVAFCSKEFPRREDARLTRRRLIRRDLRCSFGDDPILATPRNLLSTDFDKTTTLYWEEVSRWKHFYVNDRQNSMIDVMGMDFLRNEFLTDVVHLLMNGFVYDSWNTEVNNMENKVEEKSLMYLEQPFRPLRCHMYPASPDLPLAVQTAEHLVCLCNYRLGC